MYNKTEPTPAFSEKRAFKVPSTWTPPIRDAQLEIYLSEIEDENYPMKFNLLMKNGKSYPNLARKEHEVLHSLMYDDQIKINQKIRLAR